MNSNDLEIKYSRITIFLLSILCVLALGLILIEGRSVFIPFSLAVYLTLVINPIISFFEKKNIPRFISIFLTLLFVFILFVSIGTAIRQSIIAFQIKLPLYEVRISDLVSSLQGFLNIDLTKFTPENAPSTKNDLISLFSSFSFTNILGSVIQSITSVLSFMFLIMLFMLFLMMGKNNLVHKIEKSFPDKIAAKVAKIVKNITKQIQRYIIAKTLISGITSILVMVVLWIHDVDFVLIWGLLTFLFNFIPNIGSIIATLLPVFISFIQFEDPTVSFWIFLYLMIIQIIIGNIIDPKYVGKSIHLSPMTVLISLLIWGWLWGIIGMFLSVPIAVMLKIIFENIDDLKFLSTLMEG